MQLELFSTNPEEGQPLTHILPLIRDYMDEVAEAINYTNPPCTFLGEDVHTLYVKSGMVVIKTARCTVRLPVSTTLVKLNPEAMLT